MTPDDLIDRIETALVFALANKCLSDHSDDREREVKELKRRTRISRSLSKELKYVYKTTNPNG